MSHAAEVMLVKQRRPREVAQFLRLFEVDDRHDVTNLLLALGLRAFLEVQRRFKSTARSGAPQDGASNGDEILQALRNCVALGGRSMSPGAATPSGTGSTSGGIAAAVSGRRRTPSPVAPSSRCARCFPSEVKKGRSQSASSADARTRTSEPRATSTDSVSPPRYTSLRELMERDKRNFYSSKKSADFQVYEPDRAAVAGIASKGQSDAAAAPEAPCVTAVVTATTTATSTQHSTTMREASPPPSSRGTADDAREKSAESIGVSTLPTAAGVRTTATSALDFVAESRVCAPADTRNSGPSSSLAVSGSSQPKHDDQPAPDSFPQATSIPPAAIQALWQYIRSQNGARKNPLVIAAALPSEFSAVPLSSDFSRVYQSLLLAYHLNTAVL